MHTVATVCGGLLAGHLCTADDAIGILRMAVDKAKADTAGHLKVVGKTVRGDLVEYLSGLLDHRAHRYRA